jgi:DtxR family Mn-dependent transcriptional regulator
MIHPEACRWEHVMSEAVERRVLELLRHPMESPYGNPIPGMEELGVPSAVAPFLDESMIRLSDLEPGPSGASAVVRRIGELVQTDPQLVDTLWSAGVRPGGVVSVTSSAGGVMVGSGRETAELPTQTAAHVVVVKR